MDNKYIIKAKYIDYEGYYLTDLDGNEIPEDDNEILLIRLTDVIDVIEMLKKK